MSRERMWLSNAVAIWPVASAGCYAAELQVPLAKRVQYRQIADEAVREQKVEQVARVDLTVIGQIQGDMLVTQ